MDGNGRWARARGLDRIEGHAQGARAVRHAVETAARIGIEYLTLYAFSVNNWARPSEEVQALMALMVDFARSEQSELRQNGIRVEVIGQIDRLPSGTQAAVDALVRSTAQGDRMILTLALSYGSRQDVVDAVRSIAERVRTGELDPSKIDAAALRQSMTTHRLPDVDLLIRTGGESRVSDFLLLEAAYAELLFLPIMWPDFTPDALRNAVESYVSRERRFGLTSEQVQSTTDATGTVAQAAAG